MKFFFLLTAVFLFNLAFGQKMVKVGAITFDADNAGVEFPTIIKSKETFEKTGIFATYIYSSRNKKYFFVINYKKDVNDGNFENYLSTIDFTDGSKVFWTKESNYFTPTNCAIADDGMFLYVKWDEGFERDSSDKTNIFSVYDFEGKEVFTDRGVYKTIYNSDKSIIIYTKDPYKCKNEKNKIFYKDLKSGKLWNKIIDSKRELILPNISENGSCFIVIGDLVYTFNSDGEIIWTKTYENQPGWYILSKDGKYFVHMPDLGKFSIYKSIDDRILFSNEYEPLIDYKLFPLNMAFVENENEIISIVEEADNRSLKVVFLNLEGKMLDSIVVKSIDYMSFRVINKNNKYSIFLGDIKVGEYVKKW